MKRRRGYTKTRQMEKQFAVKGNVENGLPQDFGHLFDAAVQHMATYWSILEKMPGSKLRLTKLDDEIFEHLKTEFPEIDVSKTLDEDRMKSKEGKEKWRKFMTKYETRVEDYNFGTMLRSNPKFEYGEKETIFGTVLGVGNSIANLLTFTSYAHAILCHRDCQVHGLPTILRVLDCLRY